MNSYLQNVFVIEIERQSKFGLMAYQDLEQALNVLSTANDRRSQIDRFWYSVQSLLIAVGNLSKIFWPATKQEDRGRELRELFEVQDDSVLEPRTFRNHFEHFDERLENWATSSSHKNFADSNIGPPGMIGGVSADDHLRNFDTQNFAVTFRGDSYQLRPIFAALQDLHARCG